MRKHRDFSPGAPGLDFGLTSASLSLRGRSGGGLPSSPSTVYRLPSTRRPAFTLIELMVAITIIGLLAAMALGGMYRANIAAKQTNTKTTVNKVAMQINEIWESYRTRKLPIDPKLILSGAPQYTAQYNAAVGANGVTPGWIPYFNTIRGAVVPPLPTIPTAANAYNNLQIAVLRLAATRELMRLEMPCRYTDFTSNPSAINGGTPPAINSGTTPAVQTLLIPSGGATVNPGGLSEQYRQFFIAHYNAVAVPYDPATSQYEPAECLYMIIKFASQNELGQKSITDDPRLVGDADGDGMPEIQDAFDAGTFTPPALGSPFTQHNKPISFVRWPVGFLSDLQPGPIAQNATQYFESTPSQVEYAAQRHDIFDPLRIDPRAFTVTPLVYSAGPDGMYDIWELDGYASLTPSQKLFAQNDPYFTDNLGSVFPIQSNVADPPPGSQMGPGTVWGTTNAISGSGGYSDNITNHETSTKVK